VGVGKDFAMRSLIFAISAFFLLTSGARADDAQLQKAYNDTLIQLKAAQDAKNELAGVNDKLNKQIEDLKKQLSASQQRIRVLEREVSDNDGKTFELRSFFAAWQTYLKLHPELAVRWRLYLGQDALALPQEPRPLIDFNLTDSPRSLDPGE
jgi:cell division protein FtsB